LDSERAAARILKRESVLIALDFRGVASRDRIHEPKARGKCRSRRKSRRQNPEFRRKENL
jgi:hypothetical protein